MKTLDHNAITRSLEGVGYRNGLAVYRQRHEADGYRLTEVWMQYQLDVSGTTGTGAYVDATINFAEILYYAPLQRNIKTEDPHVVVGTTLDNGDAKFIVNVIKWLLDDSANYIGAIVRCGVEQVGWAPTSAFAGTIHITFQGLGIPVVDPGFDETP